MIRKLLASVPGQVCEYTDKSVPFGKRTTAGHRRGLCRLCRLRWLWLLAATFYVFDKENAGAFRPGVISTKSLVSSTNGHVRL